ncbi:hypothetical protein TNCV_1282341 [Trichonephila clavipes]|uniref:Uncharacterized protein n=1 Tax=Trichonephila clavipes TaxID=2585209 RepID=A0A8X6SNV5_TRICX|nr:hypothetical protein TNCV_1282341 [Trichonephila clavipes]
MRLFRWNNMPDMAYINDSATGNGMATTDVCHWSDIKLSMMSTRYVLSKYNFTLNQEVWCKTGMASHYMSWQMALPCKSPYPSNTPITR